MLQGLAQGPHPISDLGHGGFPGNVFDMLGHHRFEVYLNR